MKRVLIGHRGVGKTAFLERHQIYFNDPQLIHLDLDSEIEQKEQSAISEIFVKKGEPYFRALEEKTFNDLIAKNQNFVISLGAGFNLERIPNHIEVIFVSRVTDEAGRIFLNRPRLNSDLSPLAEYHERFRKRQTSYLTAANQIYFMAEGIELPNETEKAVITNSFVIDDAIYTLIEKEIIRIEKIKANFKRIELRTDLISEKEILRLIAEDPGFDWLVSIRTEAKFKIPTEVQVDCDHLLVSQDQVLTDSKNIVSSHLDSIDEAMVSLSAYSKNHLKLSPLVENFDDFLKGYAWQLADRDQRSFLPRSKSGKWLWYRQLGKYLQKINFIRNFTDVKDQPSAYQWLGLPKYRPSAFAAVLGYPVMHSRSPEEHREFFQKKNSFFTAIEINEADFVEYIVKLNEIGLTYAAVTSPLKSIAYKCSRQPTAKAEELKSVNTLMFKAREWQGHNTDFNGFAMLVSEAQGAKNDRVAVWGGGGTLAMMQSVLPRAQYFSSRSGEERESLVAAPGYFPDILIWSAPRLPDTQWPPIEWKPRLVVDLNYQESSMGLEYAQKINCKYISGLAMFKKQAEMQQEFWSRL